VPCKFYISNSAVALAHAGSLAAALADRLPAHLSVLLACFLLTTLLQGAMALAVAASFTAQVGLTVSASVVLTGAAIIADAAVMAASASVSALGMQLRVKNPANAGA